MTKVLSLSSSSRGDDSVSDLLAGELISALGVDSADVVRRDLGDLPLLTPASTGQLASPPADRTPEARADLEVSDELVRELREADVVVVGAPIYNFGPPAALKAWADLTARAGVTFNYTENGPVGLLEDRPAYIVTAAGGVPVGSPVDFGTTWLRHFLGFLGISDVTVIAAEGLAMDPEAGLAAARKQIAALASD